MFDRIQSVINRIEWQPQYVGPAAFVATVGLIALAFHLLTRRSRAIHQRMEELTGRDEEEQSNERGAVRRLLDRLASQLLPGDDTRRTQLKQRMVHAGLYDPSAAHVFVIVRLMMILVPIALAFVAVGLGWVHPRLGIMFGGAGCGIGMIAPSVWLDRRKAKRQIVLQKSLPDFLDLLVTCIESGLSLDAGLRRVTAELRHGHPVLAVEMDRVQNEIDLGAGPDAALHNLAERTDLESIHTLATFIHQARRYGTSIGEALRTHAETLRCHREQRAEEKAQKAAVKVLIPTLLFIFPAVFVVLAGPAAIQIQEHFVKSKAASKENGKKK